MIARRHNSAKPGPYANQHYRLHLKFLESKLFNHNRFSIVYHITSINFVCFFFDWPQSKRLRYETIINNINSKKRCVRVGFGLPLSLPLQPVAVSIYQINYIGRFMDCDLSHGQQPHRNTETSTSRWNMFNQNICLWNRDDWHVKNYSLIQSNSKANYCGVQCDSDEVWWQQSPTPFQSDSILILITITIFHSTE